MAVTTDASATPAGESKSWPEYRGRWLRGSMRDLRTNPLAFYTAVWRKCGGFARIRAVPGVWFYAVTHPDGVEHILQKNYKNYRKPDVLIKPVRLLVGNGLFSSEGDFWLRQRRLMQPAFRQQQIAVLSRQMAAAAAALVEEWGRGESGRVIDVVPDMMRLSLRHRQHDAVQPRCQRRGRHTGPGLPHRDGLCQPADEQSVDAAVVGTDGKQSVPCAAPRNCSIAWCWR